MALALAALLSGCGNGNHKYTKPSKSTTTASVGAKTSTTIGVTPAATSSVLVYFLRDGKLAAAARSVEAPAVGRGALEQLFAGTHQSDRAASLSTALPAGAQLQSLSIRNDVATIAVNSTTMAGADASQRKLRAAQIVATATQFSTAKSVALIADGQPVSGLPTSLSRAAFEDVTPAVLLESPTPGQSVSSPARLTGTANTFEAQFMVQIVDARGRVLVDKSEMATSGNGTRGTFDVKVAFAIGTAQEGSIVVYEVSPEDGSHTQIVKVPVHLSK